jgi:hypothetical protein
MKFGTSDQDYLARRRAFSAEAGPREIWSVMDQWPLYAGIGNLARSMAVADLFRSTLGVPGHIAEFGCWRGSNLMFLAKLLQIYDPHSMKMVHGFDSFQGLTAFVKEDGIGAEKAGAYRGSLDELTRIIDLYQMQDSVTLHVGLIEDTLPPLLRAHEALSFSFVYCDTDLYQSTATILREMHPRLMKGGLFVFDEWNWDAYPGEGKAVNEFIEEHSARYAVEHVPHARQPNLVLRKLT